MTDAVSIQKSRRHLQHGARPAPRGRRRVAVAEAGRSPRFAGRVRVGQERHAALDPAAASVEAHRHDRRDPRWRRGRAGQVRKRDGGSAWRQGRDDLPGADARAGPCLHARPADRRDDPPPREPLRGGRACPRAGAVREGAHSLARAAAGRLPARDVGRHAPAGDDRAGAVVPAAGAAGRRAHDGAGRHGADPDPPAAARIADSNSACRSSSSRTISAWRWRSPTASP